MGYSVNFRSQADINTTKYLVNTLDVLASNFETFATAATGIKDNSNIGELFCTHTLSIESILVKQLYLNGKFAFTLV